MIREDDNVKRKITTQETKRHKGTERQIPNPGPKTGTKGLEQRAKSGDAGTFIFCSLFFDRFLFGRWLLDTGH
jgi:hypothetical protein